MKLIKTFNVLSTLYAVYEIGKFIYDKVEIFKTDSKYESHRKKLKDNTEILKDTLHKTFSKKEKITSTDMYFDEAVNGLSVDKIEPQKL